MRWQWHGAGINIEKTAIYCIPSNARKVLKVDVATKTTSFIDIKYDQAKYPEFTLDVTNKWYGTYRLPVNRFLFFLRICIVTNGKIYQVALWETIMQSMGSLIELVAF